MIPGHGAGDFTPAANSAIFLCPNCADKDNLVFYIVHGHFFYSSASQGVDGPNPIFLIQHIEHAIFIVHGHVIDARETKCR